MGSIQHVGHRRVFRGSVHGRVVRSVCVSVRISGVSTRRQTTRLFIFYLLLLLRTAAALLVAIRSNTWGADASSGGLSMGV